MAYQIRINDEAESQIKKFSARERAILVSAISKCLTHQPDVVTKAIKRLRPNPLAEFELKIDDLRLLYNIQGGEVTIVLAGRKVGNKLFVEGEEFHGHQDNPTEQPGEQPYGDAT